MTSTDGIQEGGKVGEGRGGEEQVVFQPEGLEDAYNHVINLLVPVLVVADVREVALIGPLHIIAACVVHGSNAQLWRAQGFG